MTTPRDIVIHPHLHPRRTGVTSHVEAMVPALASRFEVTTIGDSLRPELPRTRWGELWRLLRSRPAVWHAHRNNELLAGLLLRIFRPRLKVVFTRHAGAAPGAYTRLLARWADQVVTLTQQSAAQMGTSARVVGHGVDLSRFGEPEDRARAFEALGLGGSHGIGVVGRVRPQKGQGDLAKALAPLWSTHPDWQLVFVGRIAPEHQSFAHGLSQTLGERVTLAGEHADVRGWYQGLTVLVHPSHSEGYSLVLLEALASGCCVVATRLPYTDGLIEHGHTGFLYEPGDVEALRAILAEVLADPSRARAIGRAGAQVARERMGLDAEAQRLGEIYRELLR